MSFLQLCQVVVGWALMATIFTAAFGIVAIVVGLALGHGLDDHERILRRVVAWGGVTVVVYAAWRFSHDWFISVPLGLSGVALIVAARMDRWWEWSPN